MSDQLKRFRVISVCFVNLVRVSEQWRVSDFERTRGGAGSGQVLAFSLGSLLKRAMDLLIYLRVET